MGDEDTITVVVRPTTRGNEERFSVGVRPTALVSELKAAIAEQSPLTPEEQRLIFKGKILKDEKTLDEYDITNNSVVHMVKGRAPGNSQSESQRAPVPAGGAPSGLGMDGIQSAAMRMMADNPELMRTMMQNNPMFMRLVESNPQFAEVLNNPSVLADTMRAMSNPDLMREQMRTNDVAMRNIETMPGGYNHLRSMFESMNEAMTGSDSAQGSAPLADVFGGMDLAGSGSGNTANQNAAERSGEPAAQEQTGINETPLPNPWQPPQPSAGTNNPLGLAALGHGGAGTGQSPASQQMMQQMMSNPEMRRNVANMMSSPAMQELMTQANPTMRQLMDSNPAMRSAMSNPELIQQMLQPEVMQPLMQMIGSNTSGGGANATAGPPDLSALTRMLGGPNAGAGSAPAGTTPDMSGLLSALGGANAGAGGTAFGNAPGNAPDMSALLGAMGGNGAGGQPDLAGLMAMIQGAGGMTPPPVPNPEEAYESQLQQLKDMGFFDQQENIRALQATGGNVNAAVERLLA